LILVSVVIWFVRTFLFDANIAGLLIAELGKLYSNFFEMQSGNLFIQMFGKTIDAEFILFCCQFNLCECLVCK